jgi:formylglycine-generating enzyme required for sulfatase activity
MVVIPAGEFLMGSSAADTERDLAAMNIFLRLFAKPYLQAEHPQHKVHILQPFALGRYLITRGEFAAFVRATGHATDGGCNFLDLGRYRDHPDGGWQNPGFPQTDRDPVVCVNLWDAQAYAAWLNAKQMSSGGGYGNGLHRLPTEVEWEYAARAGQRTAYWWGDDIGRNNADCDGCGSPWDRRRTAPVGSFRPNQLGLYDMLGNAAEWTRDCFHTSYDGAPSDNIAWTWGDCHGAVVRGHDWSSEPWALRSAYRTGLNPNQRTNRFGFRVAKPLP